MYPPLFAAWEALFDALAQNALVRRCGRIPTIGLQPARLVLDFFGLPVAWSEEVC